jgi:hypothetical protein
MLSLPCIRRMAGESGPVHFAGRGDVGALLRESGLAAETSAAGDARYLSLQSGVPDEPARGFLARFDRAMVVTVAPEGPLVAAVRSVIPATQAVRSLPPDGSGQHVAWYRLDQVGGTGETHGPFLPVPSVHRDLAAGMLARAGYDGSRKVLAVHPGSGSRAKNWPLGRYLEVLDACTARADPFVLFFTGPAEDDQLKDHLDDVVRRRSGWVHYPSADLSALAALLTTADLYLGNDSGVSHLAASVGCRTIVLYGPTDPARWRPVGAQVEVVQAAELAAIPVEDVVARVLQALVGPDGTPEPGGTREG